MDFGALPPEINSGRMYTGPGCGSMLAAAAAWDGLAADLHSTAASYQSVISDLTGAAWLGPASVAMTAAATPYVSWLTATAALSEQAATQARAAAAAYEAAFAMTVPPPMIAANRAQLMSLIATNILGQNTPAIAATEAAYGEMWAQDAGAMYEYAGASAAASALPPFTAPPAHHKSSRGRQPGCCRCPRQRHVSRHRHPDHLVDGLAAALRSAQSASGTCAVFTGGCGSTPVVLTIAQLAEPGELGRFVGVGGHYVDGHGRVVCGLGICGALRPRRCQQAGYHSGTFGGWSGRLRNRRISFLGFGRPAGRQRFGTRMVSGFGPSLLNRRAVGAADLGQSRPADHTRRGSMAEHPPNCRPDGPGSEPGKHAHRNAFGEYGRTRHPRCSPSGPAHDHQDCDAAPAG